MRTFFVMISIGLSACGGGGSQPVAGPCDVEIDGPLILVDSVKNAVSMQALNSVTLSDVRFAGVASNLAAITSVSSGIAISGTNLQCSVPCGFASSEGKYSFTVQAPGYQSTTVDVDAAYSSQAGSCPVVLSGGTKLNITMTPI